MKNPWLRVGVNAWALAFESSAVIGLRTMKIAAGGTAANGETTRMVNEKIEAGLALQAKAFSGELGMTAPGVLAMTLAHYRRKVRANRRRLSKA